MGAGYRRDRLAAPRSTLFATIIKANQGNLLNVVRINMNSVELLTLLNNFFGAPTVPEL
jgi:hypothetical protein